MPSVPDPANVKPWYLRNITEALALDEASGNVYVRTGFQGNIIISGNVNIPGEIDTHIVEVGNSGNLKAANIGYLPIGGNVVVTSGNINAAISGNVVVTSGNVNANVSGTVTVNQGTTPWVTTSTVTGNVAIGDFPQTALTAFEEPLAVGITPIIQAESVYGLDPDIWHKTELNNGNIVAANSTWQVNSGTSTGGYARLATTRYMTYNPGQGAMFRWTVAFTADGTTKNAFGVAGIVQTSGPIDREDGFAIGYSGITTTNNEKKIGILHRRNGKVETRQLTITTASGGAQTATITLNGVSFSISLTTGSSTNYTATQIAKLLKANTVCENTWDIEACGSVVTFSYYAPGARNGTYSFSSTGTGTLAAGTFSQLVAGATPTDTWYYVDSWNGTVPVAFDPTKLNIFGIDFRWLGAGRIRFFMEDPATGKFLLIHTILYAGTALLPHLSKPSLRITYRSGTTSGATPSQNVTVTGASAFAGIQGIVNQTGMSQGYYHVDSSTRAKDLTHHLLSIQNPIIRNNTVNKSSIILQDLTISAQGNDPSVIFIIKNSVGTSDLLLFDPIPNSSTFNFVQNSISAVTENLTLDSPNNIQTLGINSSSQFDLRPYNVELTPGDYISVFILSTNALTRTATGITWRVD